MLTASATVDGKDVNMQAVEGSANALASLKVVNTRGYTPPMTGDNGNWMYGVIAALLLAVAASTLYLAFRKRKSEDK